MASVPCSCSADRLDIFDEKAARRALRRYLDDGLGGSDALQIAAWAEEGGLDGRTVVEVGGGIGQIQADLLRRGAAAGRIVGARVRVRGPRGRARAAERASPTGRRSRSPTCSRSRIRSSPPTSSSSGGSCAARRTGRSCSPPRPGRLAARCSRATRATGGSCGSCSGLENLGFAVFRKRFRSFVHRPAELERAVAERGFARSRVARGLIWETAQFVPNDAVAGAAPAS